MADGADADNGRSRTRLKLVRRTPTRVAYKPFLTIPAGVYDRCAAEGSFHMPFGGGRLISSQDAAISKRLQEQTKIVLEALTPRERLVLRRRFGVTLSAEQPLDGCDEVLTPAQIAIIEATALRKLRHPSPGTRLRSVDRR